LREAISKVNGTEPEDVRLRARLLSRLAAALTPSVTPAEPLALAREALQMTRHEADLRTRIDVGVAVGAALTDFAPPDERIVVNERLVRDAREASDRILELRGLTRLACDHLERGDIASAEAVIAERQALAQRIGQPRHLWQTPLLRSMRAMAEGRFDACDACIEEARHVSLEADDPNADRCVTAHRFWMLLVAGRTAPLRAHEPDIQRVMGSLPDGPMYRPWVSAIVAARCGDEESAARELRSLGSPLRIAARMSRATTAETALACGVDEWFEPLHDSLLAEGDDANAAWGPFAFACAPPIKSTLAGLAFALGRPEDGARHAERALALSERMGARAHQVWVNLAWGEGLAACGDPRARERLERALAGAEELDMPLAVASAKARLESAVRPRAEVKESGPLYPRFALTREAPLWRLEVEGRTFRLKDTRGLGMLARLVENPGREIHALEIASDPPAGAEGSVLDLGDAGEVIDKRAALAYRKRIVDLRDELEEAERFADTGRAERLRRELEEVTDHLGAAMGLGGRERRAGSAAERARIVAQRRIREAIRKIGEHDEALGRHLDWTVRTGTFCAYEPEGRKTGR
jgi:hypothetical protein